MNERSMKDDLLSLSAPLLPAAFGALLLAGCPENTLPGTGTDAGISRADASSSVDAGPSVDRSERTLELEGDPNGLYWDDKTGTLYVADDNGNRILAWSDAKNAFTKVVDLPNSAASEGAGLGQLVLATDGSLVVTRFGYGTVGDVVYSNGQGSPTVVPNLDPSRRRIGLTESKDGTLYDCWFVRMSNGARAGSVGRLSLTGSEPEVMTGLKKPVGVLALGDSLFVSDQDLGQILKAPLASPANYTVFATVVAPDLLAAGPDGSLFTGSTGGSLYRVSANGAAAVFKSGFQAIRGVAYDAKNRRLFVADHDDDEKDGFHHSIRVLPVE